METVSRSALDELLESVAGDDPEARVAVLDLDLHHLGCTKAYATQLGQDRTRVVAAALGTLVADAPPLHRSFDEVLLGELDFRTVDIQPLAATSPMTLHAAMIRGEDATPWCIIVVATPVPQLPPDIAPPVRPVGAVSGSDDHHVGPLASFDRFGGVPDAPDWGHATELDDVRGQVAIVGIGETAYTKASGRTAREIGAEAAERAIADAGLEPARHRRPHVVGRVRRLRRRRVPRALRHDARDVDVAVGRRHGVGRDRARTSRPQAIARGQGAPRAQRVPGRVGDAARRR